MKATVVKSATGDGRGQIHRLCLHPVLGFVSSGHAGFVRANTRQRCRESPSRLRRRVSAHRWPLRAQCLCPPFPANCPAVPGWLAPCRR